MNQRYYENLLQANITLNKFMGELAMRYSQKDMHKLWMAKEEMCRKFGDVFVAKTIEKDRNDAELAMFRYARDIEEEPEPEFYTEIKPPKSTEYRRNRYGKGLKTVALYAVTGAVAALFSFAGIGGAL